MLRRIGICLLALGLAACNGTMDQSGALKWPLGGGPVMNPTIHAATAQAVKS